MKGPTRTLVVGLVLQTLKGTLSFLLLSVVVVLEWINENRTRMINIEAEQRRKIMRSFKRLNEEQHQTKRK